METHLPIELRSRVPIKHCLPMYVMVVEVGSGCWGGTGLPIHECDGGLWVLRWDGAAYPCMWLWVVGAEMGRGCLFMNVMVGSGWWGGTGPPTHACDGGLWVLRWDGAAYPCMWWWVEWVDRWDGAAYPCMWYDVFWQWTLTKDTCSPFPGEWSLQMAMCDRPSVSLQNTENSP